MLVNVVDVPPLCNFIMPAIVRNGPISIAISTSGASPALAKRLKREIAERVRRALRAPRRAPERPARLGEGHVRHLPGAQGLLRGSSTAIPTRGAPRRRATSAAVRELIAERQPRRRRRRVAARRGRRRFVDDVAALASARLPHARRRGRRARPPGAAARAARTSPATSQSAPRSRRSCSSARRWATPAAASPASRSPPSARCTLGSALRGTSQRPEGFSEQSGTIVHGLLGDLGLEHRVLLWNVVPAHPHRPGRRSRTGSRPRPSAVPAARCCARCLMRVRPVAVVPVGRTAERTLARAGHRRRAGRAAPGEGRRDAASAPRRARALGRALLCSDVARRRARSASVGRLAQSRIALRSERLRSISASAMKPTATFVTDDRRSACRPRTRAAPAAAPRRRGTTTISACWRSDAAGRERQQRRRPRRPRGRAARSGASAWMLNARRK